MGKFIDLTGQKFGRLAVIQRAENGKGNNARFKCACDCGRETITLATHLRSGHSTSCGCLAFEKMQEASIKHGMSKTPLHNIWKEMRARCERSSHARFSRYGGRGIKVFEAWSDYQVFFEYVSPTYKRGMQLDRINNDGNYEPGNVRWVDCSKNVRNSSCVKINESDAGVIKSLLANGVRQKNIADMFQISKYLVHDIARGRTWKDVSMELAW